MIDPAVCPPRSIEAAVAVIRAAWRETPRVAIVLGSGLGDITCGVEIAAEFAYKDLPHYPRSSLIGHNGRLVCGEFAGAPVAVMDGRFHFYEGFALNEICLPIAVLHALGAETLVVTNASGGLNPGYRSGEIMAIADHINLLSAGPHAAEKAPIHGIRWDIWPRHYDAELLAAAQRVARREGFACHQGVYVGVQGPNYETRAEYRAFRKLGGDAVGMSTIPEVIAARHCGMRVLALSMITNVACPDRPCKTTAEEVCRLAALAGPNLRHILRGIVRGD